MKPLNTSELPENAVKLFILYLKDAGNWSGTPLVGSNVVLLGEKEDRGLLSYLKRAGVVETWQDEENKRCFWLRFTDAGVAFATSLGWIANGRSAGVYSIVSGADVQWFEGPTE